MAERRTARVARGRMSAWQELSPEEYGEVWDRFQSQFRFRPSVRHEDWPAIVEPMPSITYRFDYPLAPVDIEDLHDSALAAFRECVPEDGRLYALDWQHPSYWLSPHVPLARWDRPGLGESCPSDRWHVPVLPNGDYYIFLDRTLSWGLFGHPWEQTICVFGEPILGAFQKREPRVFGRVVRRR